VVGGDDPSGLETVNNRIQFCEVYAWVDRTIVHLQPVLEWLQKRRVIDRMRISKDQRRRLRRVHVKVVKPVNSITQAERLMRADN